VVNAGGGTGRSAGLGYAELCGKTGTAQWGPKSKNQRLAWFAGFMPRANPRYAFAVLYEGRPGEGVSGGRMAAPMVQKFFQGIKGDIKEIIAPPKKALVVINEETGEAAEQAAPVVQMDDVEGNEDSESVENSVDLESDGRGVIRALPVDDVAEGGDVVPRADANFSGSVERGALPALPVEDDDVLDENVETQ
jgi:penicillin-binding protein 2